MRLYVGRDCVVKPIVGCVATPSRAHFPARRWLAVVRVVVESPSLVRTVSVGSAVLDAATAHARKNPLFSVDVGFTVARVKVRCGLYDLCNGRGCFCLDATGCL